MVAATLLRFQGHIGFRQRIILSAFSGKPIRIDKIHSDNEAHPGLTDYEISFLKLIEKMCNGCVIEISFTGTCVLFRPGVITGGKIIHDCPPSRALGYYLEPIIALSVFAKTPLQLTLRGITNDNIDVSVDSIRTVVLPFLKNFGIEEDFEMKIVKRGAVPLGGGEIQLICPTIRTLKHINCIDLGQIKRIRGIAYATRISPNIPNRVIESAKTLLTKFIPDVYLYTDIYKGAESGKSPGYALSLVAESTSGSLLSTELAFQPKKLNIEMQEQHQQQQNDKEKQDVEQTFKNGKDKPKSSKSASVFSEKEAKESVDPQNYLIQDYNFETPEELGIRVAKMLLLEIKKSGCLSSISQWIGILFMVLGPEDISKIRISELNRFNIALLRDIYTFFGTTFKIQQDMDKEHSLSTVILTCLGTGYTNVNKKVI